MSIHTNMDSVRNYNVFNQNQAAASKAMSHATTGLKIASVADGPASWAVSEKMRERINSLNQASQNIQNDTAMAKTASDGIANTVEILRSLKARVLQGADAATNETDRGILVKEIGQLIDQIDTNKDTVKFNGKELLTATETFTFQVGDASGLTIELSLETAMTSSGLELNKNSFTAVALKETSSSAPLIDAIDTAIGKALSAATTIGSIQNRLGYTADNVNAQIENLQASDSAIRDADMAKEISDYLKWNVLSQASQYMLAQSNQNAFAALNLLQ